MGKASEEARTLRFGLPGSQLPARDVTKAAVLAEGAGFDSMWWADRLMGWMADGPHALLDPVAVMAAAAVPTSRIMLGTAVVDPLRRHPAQLAQTGLSLQHITGGRLLLGTGCGEAAGTEPYGISFDTPVGRLEEALEVMRVLWAEGKPVSFEGKHYRLDDAICGLASVVAPPPVWLAAHGPRMLRITGERADGWLPTAHGAHLYARQLAAIRDSADAAGRQAGSVEPGAFIWLVAADSRERARRLIADSPLRALGLLMPAGALSRSPMPDGPWASLVPTRGGLEQLTAQVDADELAAVLPHGSPDDIAADILPYVQAGARHLVLCDMSPVSGQDNGLGGSWLDVYTAIRERLTELAS
jgi:phthiodiolone/phenolphthiodiolone dimycocerosates ketoreductase